MVSKAAMKTSRMLSIIKSHPRLKKEYEQLVTDIEQLNRRPPGIEVSISHDNKSFKSVRFMEVPGSKTIDKIAVGVYNIAFATGELIWEGKFTMQDLIWSEAYPGRSFALAADTPGPKPEPTKEISVFDGDIIIRVFAGLESGRIEITINAVKDSQ